MSNVWTVTQLRELANTLESQGKGNLPLIVGVRDRRYTVKLVLLENANPPSHLVFWIDEDSKV